MQMYCKLHKSCGNWHVFSLPLFWKDLACCSVSMTWLQHRHIVGKFIDELVLIWIKQRSPTVHAAQFWGNVEHALGTFEICSLVDQINHGQNGMAWSTRCLDKYLAEAGSSLARLHIHRMYGCRTYLYIYIRISGQIGIYIYTYTCLFTYSSMYLSVYYDDSPCIGQNSSDGRSNVRSCLKGPRKLGVQVRYATKMTTSQSFDIWR